MAFVESGAVPTLGTTTLADASNLVLGTTTGTEIGTTTSQKLGFYGTTPVVQQAGTADPITALKALGLMASGTTPLTVPGAFVASGAAGLNGQVTLGDGINLAAGTSTGTAIGTATTQKLAFYGATPIVQPASTTDLRTALINLGLLATGGASPLNLNGGALTTAAATLNGKVTAGNASAPSAPTAGAQAGTTPPAPVLVAGSNDTAGSITFGTGTGPALGEMVVVVFGTTQGSTPKSIQVVATNAATGLKIPCTTAKSATGFSIGFAVAPTASQANTVYAVDYLVIA